MPNCTISPFKADVVSYRNRGNLQIHVGMLCVEAVQARDEPSNRQSGCYFQAQQFLRLFVGHLIQRVVQAIKRIRYAVSESFTNGGKLDFTPRLLEKLGAQPRFQMLDLLTNGARSHMKHLSGARNALGTTDGIEHP